MPSFNRLRIRSLTGEIYFEDCTQAKDDAALAALLEGTLKNSGLADGADQLNQYGNPAPNPSSLTAAQESRTAVFNAVLAGPSVNASVVNGYTGPEISPAGVFPVPTAIALVDSELTRQLVGHPIMVYQIPQIVQVTYPASLAFGGIFLDNYPLNRTDFRMVRGVQNEINFYVRDVDRKPVSLGITESLTINIVDLATDTLLMSRNLTTIDNTQGIYLLTVLPSEMDTWPTTPVRWSLGYNRVDGSTVLMWTDRGYSPYSTLTVSKGPVPGPMAAVIMQPGDLVMHMDGYLYSQSLRGSAANGYVGGVQTFVISLTNFTGSIRVDGSLVTAPVNTPFSPDWFQVDLQTYTDTGTVVLNEVGNFLWMRIVFLPYTGAINGVQYKS
jgi:hypothetical protein